MLCNTGLERAVIGGICQYGADAYFDIADILTTSTFTVDSNRVIFDCIKEIFVDDVSAKIEPVLITSIANKLGYTDWFAKKNERDYLGVMFQSKVSKDNVSKYAAKIRKLEISRNLYDVIGDIQKHLVDVTGDEKIDAILALVENPIMDFSTMLNGSTDEGIVCIAERIEDYVKYLEENVRETIGLPTGYPRWDMAIGGGLRRKSVSLIGARMKVGKSTLGLNIGLNVASKEIPVLYLDTELNVEDIMTIMLARTGVVDRIETETGKFTLNSSNRARIHDAKDIIKHLPFHYRSIAGCPFEQTISFMRKWIMQKVGYNNEGKLNDCLIIYDYIKLMTGDGLSHAMQEYQALGFLMTSMHNFCVRYDLPILTFAQLNRDGIDKESTDAVSGSDRLGWLCSNLSIYKEKTTDEIVEDGQEYGNRKLIPIACRHGKGMDFGNYINMQMDGAYCSIIEKETKFEIKKSKATNRGFEVENDDGKSELSLED